MVKFPLEQPPYPPIHILESDQRALIELADVFVGETLQGYERHLIMDNGVVDVQEWIPINQFENVTVYQSRRALIERRQSRAYTMRERSAKPPEMLEMLWFGTIVGQLDDIMYAAVNPTAEEAKAKAAYVESNVLDVALLSTLVHPTPDDPFLGLQVKWAVNGGPAAMRPVVRCRDFVYLESTGMTTTTAGERVGFHILHSIGLPGADKPLQQHKVIRGEISLCHFFRQRSDNVVETYVRAFIDVKGDMPLRMATKMSARGVVSVWKLPEYSFLKKLNWHMTHRQPDPIKLSDACSFCGKGLHGAMTRRKTCRVCTSPVCSRCYVSKKMYYVQPQTRAVVARSACVCMTCVREVAHTNGLDIARGELSRRYDQHAVYSYLAASSPTSSSSSLMP